MASFFKELTNTVKKELILAEQESFVISPGEYTTPDNSAYSFDMIGGSFNYFRYTGFGSCVDAYNRCPIVSSIINQQAQAFVNGKIKFFDSDNNEIKKGNAIVDKMKKLMSRPNPLQSWKVFEAQVLVYLKLFGFAVILPVKPFGFKNNIDATSLWNIPPSWLSWNYIVEKFNQYGGQGLQEIEINYNGERTIIKLSDLIIIKDFVPQMATAGTQLTFPQSKVHANEMFINNIIGALESRNMLINYRGALGILSNDAGSGQYQPLQMLPDDKDELQKDFKRYGLRKNQFQVIITTATLKWQEMGKSTKDLMLMEEVVDSSIGLCAAWNFPPFILGFKDATFHNMNEAEKHLYQNSTMPDADNIYESFSDYFGLSIAGISMRKDFSHIAALQEDKLDEATRRLVLNKALEMEWRNGRMTLNQWCEKLGEPALNDKRGEMYFPEYVAAYGDPNVRVTERIGDGTTPTQEQKMLARRQQRDDNGRYTELYRYIFDNTTPNGQEI